VRDERTSDEPLRGGHEPVPRAPCPVPRAPCPVPQAADGPRLGTVQHTRTSMTQAEPDRSQASGCASSEEAAAAKQTGRR